MKYIYILFTLLCLGLLLGLVNDHGKEIKELREGYWLVRQENRQLRADLALSNHNAQRVIDEVREILEGKNFIPVWDYRTFLVYDMEEMEDANTNARKSR